MPLGLIGKLDICDKSECFETKPSNEVQGTNKWFQYITIQNKRNKWNNANQHNIKIDID